MANHTPTPKTRKGQSVSVAPSPYRGEGDLLLELVGELERAYSDARVARVEVVTARGERVAIVTELLPSIQW